MKKKKIIGICCIMMVIIIFLVVSIIIINANDGKKEMNVGNIKSNSSESTEGGSESENSEVLLSETEENTEENTVEIPVVSTEKWDLTKVNIVYDTNNVPVPVPKGYVASGADGEHTVNTGFVIYEGEGEVTTENAWDESLNRNQWVWVPVPDSSRVYSVDANGRKSGKIYDYSSTGRTLNTSGKYPYYFEPGFPTDVNYGFTERIINQSGIMGESREKMYQTLCVEYDFTIESIEKYGGFYIGRYETGDLSNKIPVVKRMNTDIAGESFAKMYTKTKYLEANSNVKVNMIWASLWYETLEWFMECNVKNYEEVGSDSTGWGNYPTSTFEYIGIDGKRVTKATDNIKRIPTGSTEYTNVNQIYDIAGNVHERSLCRVAQGYMTFGGCASNNYTVYHISNSYSKRSTGKNVVDYSVIEPGSYSSYHGFRVYMYIR